MKLQHIAAAALALTAFGSANAAIDAGNVSNGSTAATAGNGNGSLVLIAYDKTGGTTTAGVFDLGIALNDFVGATANGTTGLSATALQSQNLSWNLLNNTFSVNGAASTAYGNNSWTAAWNTLLANSDAADLQFVVTAFDVIGAGANTRSLVTGSATSTFTFSGTVATGLTQVAGGKSNDIFLPIANKGTIGSADNGAYTFTAADGATTRANGYVMAGDGFANEWRNFNGLGGETFASSTTALYLVDGLGKKAIAGANGDAGYGVLKLDAATGVLSYTVSAVPEPTTYALLVAGLAVVGAAARRRRA